MKNKIYVKILVAILILLLALSIFMMVKSINLNKQVKQMQGEYSRGYTQGITDLVSTQTQKQSCLILIENQTVEVPIVRIQ
jgi:YbbR domain-containing protein